MYTYITGQQGCRTQNTAQDKSGSVTEHKEHLLHYSIFEICIDFLEKIKLQFSHVCYTNFYYIYLNVDVGSIGKRLQFFSCFGGINCLST